MAEQHRLERECRASGQLKEVKFLPTDAMEFTLRRDRFGGDRWRVRVDVHLREPFVIHPPDTIATEDEGWLELRL